MYETLFAQHAQLLQALAHPKRLEILQLLRNGELSVSEIQSMLDLPQANLSQHLQILREAEVVATKREGKNILYHIAHSNFTSAIDTIREVLVERHQHDQLGAELSLNMLDLVPLTHDPVCGMRVSPRTASAATQYNDATYYFCASGCLETFKKKPEKYV